MNNCTTLFSRSFSASIQDSRTPAGFLPSRVTHTASPGKIVTSAVLACSSAVLMTGCASSPVSQASTARTTPSQFQLSPATVNLTQGNSVTFAPSSTTTSISSSSCIWQAKDQTILSSKGNGEFVGTSPGSSTVTATCGDSIATASVLVAPAVSPTSITITSGGTYSGSWSSSDPAVPAVTIRTNEPVVLKNSTVTGRGDLIVIYGAQAGANVTVQNVTGTALDPGVNGMAKGKFIDAEVMANLSVTHSTMHNVSFGVYIVASPRLASLIIKENLADRLDDRKSDGNGGYLLNQRVLGHLIQLNGIVLPNGGEIAWNQMINPDGDASVEDIINLYESHGASGKPVLIHDNYLQGGFAAGQTTYYTGVGIQMDGGSNDLAVVDGFVTITGNTIVHLAGGGISIGAGHDISVIGNRIVSCGKDAAGNWLATPDVAALGMWNYYQSSQYFNNTIANNSGGLVRPSADGQPVAGNIDDTSASAALNNVVSSNSFDQPCLVGSTLNLAAESVEFKRWLASVASAGETLGDQH
jgi:hypothetical protein